jgi:EmrB/QacA subfamily drug resistance transporter
MSSALYTGCDASTAHAVRAGAGIEHPRLVLTTTILASSLAFVDGSVVNVGLSAIGRNLDADAGDLQWIINGYLLPLSALLLLGGASGDRFGRRLLLIVGIMIFAVASLACALAPNLGWFLTGRLVQGVGAAILMPNSLAILGQAFAGEAKGRAIGVWAAAGAIAGAIGPVLGGWFIDLGSWRAIFLLNLPLAAGAILLAWRYVPPMRNDGAAQLDGLGALLATAGLGILTWALTLGSGTGGWSAAATAASVGGLALLLLFVAVEKRRGDKAMMPVSMFASKGFVGLTILTLLLYAALGGLLVLLPYVLIKVSGYSGTAAGAALLPLPLVLALTSPMMGGIAGRTGARLPLVVSPLIVAAGFLLMLRITPDTTYWSGVLPAIFVVAIGMAGAVAPLTAAVLGAVDARHTGSASGLNSAVARTGGLIATALLGAALAAEGAALLSAFRIGAVISAACCIAASLNALILYRK